ncbi:ribosomal L7Ae/L30e/S12e/Gadd45 family protein [Erysipelothrix urinaevulpis]|uniref:L7Ae/L30e/S12e/Gadd45 family ribosomal protein n=1 Tax=Erysipelothrix urinaevulpis TaxID=2683717 RepID=UPI00135736AF|nr:ribosomal L7Ae/L30e/S12e/Gadd45 family protein [Erysipelothrix urinaevulpis]
MLTKQRFQQTLGLCQRARLLVSGDELMKSLPHQVKLIVLANDASLRTQKQLKDKAKTYKVPVIELLSSQEIEEATSLMNRAAVGVIDEGLAKKLSTYIEK